MTNTIALAEPSPSKVGEVDLEKLLIRYFLIKFGDGGSVSNNQKAKGQYKNETGKDVMVYVKWNAKYTIGDKSGSASFGIDAATWNANTNW
ncbi:hypothetical protein GCM10022293_62200 [Azospirillum formosense]